MLLAWKAYMAVHKHVAWPNSATLPPSNTCLACHKIMLVTNHLYMCSAPLKA